MVNSSTFPETTLRICENAVASGTFFFTEIIASPLLLTSHHLTVFTHHITDPHLVVLPDLDAHSFTGLTHFSRKSHTATCVNQSVMHFGAEFRTISEKTVLFFFSPPDQSPRQKWRFSGSADDCVRWRNQGGEWGEISPRIYMIPCQPILYLGTVKHCNL